MTKAELVNNIFEKAKAEREPGTPHLTKADIERVLDLQGDVVGADLAKGGSTKLPGLGTLAPVQRKARNGRNPKTGEPLMIPAKLVVKFSTSKKLDAALNPNPSPEA